MGEYYGVIRSSEYLAHYGVKGMRWGVHKSIEKGDMGRLADHYQRAVHKNSILKERTSIKGQKQEAKDYAKAGAALLGVGGLSGLAAYGISKAFKRKSIPSEFLVPSVFAGAGGLSAFGAGVGSAYRTTKHGHKRAVKKYNEFNGEMKKLFPKSRRRKIRKFLKQHPEYDWRYLG